jgi:prevent-host-death family protein
VFYTRPVEQIPIRELNQQTSATVARAQRGEALAITSNGRVVARLVPVEPSPLDNLIRQGRVIPATDHKPIPLPIGAVDATLDATDIVSELREERL